MSDARRRHAIVELGLRRNACFDSVRLRTRLFDNYLEGIDGRIATMPRSVSTASAVFDAAANGRDRACRKILLPMSDVTGLLARWNRGDADAFAELMPVVYAELRKLANHYMQNERRDHTLQPTALVHEAFIRLTAVRDGQFANRVHFYGAAAQAMRRILVDHARQRRTVRRGGNPTKLNLDDVDSGTIDLRFDFVAIDQALDQLADFAPRPAKVVELRYFGGMTVDEVAAFLEIAPITVKRHWATARAWLYRTLSN